MRKFHVLSLTLVLGLISAIALAEDKQPAQPAKAPTQQEMMEMMMKYGTPGPEHEKLKPMVGTFDADCTFQMTPDMPAMASKGQMVNEMILDGRYIKGHYKGDMMGQPFTGMSLMGFDKMKEKYTSLWVDSMSTNMMLSEGSADSSGKVITTSCTFDCPLAQGKQTMRQVLTITDNDHHVMEGYTTGPDGKEFKTMTIKYSRAKNATLGVRG